MDTSEGRMPWAATTAWSRLGGGAAPASYRGTVERLRLQPCSTISSFVHGPMWQSYFAQPGVRQGAMVFARECESAAKSWRVPGSEQGTTKRNIHSAINSLMSTDEPGLLVTVTSWQTAA